jgi:hypothetical protein
MADVGGRRIMRTQVQLLADERGKNRTQAQLLADERGKTSFRFME